MTSLTLISLMSGLSGMLGWGLYDFFAGVYAKKIGAYRTLFWSQLVGGIAVILLAMCTGVSLQIPFSAMLLLPLASVLYSGGYLFFMRGFEVGNISIVAAIMNLWAVFTMLIAFLFMGQRLTVLQFVGVVMIITGAVMASLRWRDLKNRNFQLSAGVKETVVGACLFGAFWNVSDYLSEELGWLATTLFIKAGIVVFLVLYFLLTKRKFTLGQGGSLRTALLLGAMGIIEAGAIAVVNYGLSVGDAILITPIASALSVVTILLAILFLREKVDTLQKTGIITAVLGIVVTSL